MLSNVLEIELESLLKLGKTRKAILSPFLEMLKACCHDFYSSSERLICEPYWKGLRSRSKYVAVQPAKNAV